MSDENSRLVGTRYLQPGMQLQYYVGKKLGTFEIIEVDDIKTRTVTNLNFGIKHEVQGRDVKVRNVETNEEEVLHPWLDVNFRILIDSIPSELFVQSTRTEI